MFAIGLAGASLHAGGNRVDPEFSLAFLAVAVVGLGSLAFHATLRWEWQAADEVPMLYTALIYVYILVCDRWSPPPAARRALKLSLLIWSFVVTLLVTLSSGSAQFYLFHLSFGSAQLWSLYETYRVYRLRRAANPEIRQEFETGLKLYVAGMASWATDLVFCHRVDGGPGSFLPFNPQLHAVWHVLASLGLYHLTVVLLLNRAASRGGARARLGLAAGLLPYVVVTSVEKV